MYAEPSRLEFSPVGESHVKMRTPSAPPMNPNFPPPPLTPPDSGEYSHLSKGCTPAPFEPDGPAGPVPSPVPTICEGPLYRLMYVQYSRAAERRWMDPTAARLPAPTSS